MAMSEYRRNSFEPRLAIVQLVFGIIYGFMSGISIVLLFNILGDGGNGYLQIFFILLFLILALKSFWIYAKTRISQQTGVYTTAVVEKITPTHGLTILEGQLKMPDNTTLPIESRFAGEGVAHELQRFLDENNTKKLPALLVDKDTKHPRGMFCVKTTAGHLDRESINQLKTN